MASSHIGYIAANQVDRNKPLPFDYFKKMKPRDIALQFTRSNCLLFERITAEELKEFESTGDTEKKGLKAEAAKLNEITSYVLGCILNSTPQEIAKEMEKWLKIIENCIERGDLFSAFAIFQAFTIDPVGRLIEEKRSKPPTVKLSGSAKKLHSTFATLFSTNDSYLNLQEKQRSLADQKSLVLPVTNLARRIVAGTFENIKKREKLADIYLMSTPTDGSQQKLSDELTIYLYKDDKGPYYIVKAKADSDKSDKDEVKKDIGIRHYLELKTLGESEFKSTIKSLIRSDNTALNDEIRDFISKNKHTYPKFVRPNLLTGDVYLMAPDEKPTKITDQFSIYVYNGEEGPFYRVRVKKEKDNKDHDEIKEDTYEIIQVPIKLDSLRVAEFKSSGATPIKCTNHTIIKEVTDFTNAQGHTQIRPLSNLLEKSSYKTLRAKDKTTKDTKSLELHLETLTEKKACELSSRFKPYPTRSSLKENKTPSTLSRTKPVDPHEKSKLSEEKKEAPSPTTTAKSLASPDAKEQKELITSNASPTVPTEKKGTAVTQNLKDQKKAPPANEEKKDYNLGVLGGTIGMFIGIGIGAALVATGFLAPLGIVAIAAGCAAAGLVAGKKTEHNLQKLQQKKLREQQASKSKLDIRVAPDQSQASSHSPAVPPAPVTEPHPASALPSAHISHSSVDAAPTASISGHHTDTFVLGGTQFISAAPGSVAVAAPAHSAIEGPVLKISIPVHSDEEKNASASRSSQLQATIGSVSSSGASSSGASSSGASSSGSSSSAGASAASIMVRLKLDVKPDSTLQTSILVGEELKSQPIPSISDSLPPSSSSSGSSSMEASSSSLPTAETSASSVVGASSTTSAAPPSDQTVRIIRPRAKTR